MPPMQLHSLTELRINSTSRMKKTTKEKLTTKNWRLFLPTRRSSPLKPVRLREHYPESQRQLPQEGPPPQPPPWRKGTRRERNP
jgi:hypothetical protein